jgi:mRNA interferase MazF
MKHGDVYWHTFRTPDKRRPVVVLTRSSAIPFLTGVTVAPITSTIRGLPTEVVLSPADGLETDCVVNLDSIQTVQKSNIGPYLTSLSAELMAEVRDAVDFAFGFERLG